MLERLKGAVLLFPLLFILLAGGNLLYFTTFILSLLGIKELYTTFRIKGFNPISIVAVGFCSLILIHNIFSIPMFITVIAYFLLFAYASTFVIRNTHSIIDLCITLFGIIYIAIPFECIINIYETSTKSFNLVWIVLLIAFSNDSFAYFIGKKLGKKKLIPDVSPNKTVEGSIGGIVGTILVLTSLSTITDLNIGVLFIMAALGSIAAQIGDLFASSIKRYSGVKDFSNAIPGHGGIIDRFDSILFVAPLILSLTYFICG